MNKEILPWIYTSIGIIIGIISLMIFGENEIFFSVNILFITSLAIGCFCSVIGLKEKLSIIVGGVIGFIIASFSPAIFPTLLIACCYLLFFPVWLSGINLTKNEKIGMIVFFFFVLLAGWGFLIYTDAPIQLSEVETLTIDIIGTVLIIPFFILSPLIFSMINRLTENKNIFFLFLYFFIFSAIACLLLSIVAIRNNDWWGLFLSLILVVHVILFPGFLDIGDTLSIGNWFFLFFITCTSFIITVSISAIFNLFLFQKLLFPIVLFPYIGYKIGSIIKEGEEEREKRLQILMKMRDEIASMTSRAIPPTFKSEARYIQKEIDMLSSKKYISQFKIDKINSSIYLLRMKIDQFYAKISDIEKEINKIISSDPANLTIKANQIMEKIQSTSNDEIIQRKQEIEKEINSVRKEIIEKENRLKMLTRQRESNMDELNKIDSYLKRLEKNDPANVGIKIKKIEQEWKNFSRSEIQSLKVYGEIEELLKRKYLLNFSIPKVEKEIEHLKQEINGLYNKENRLKIEKLLIQREKISRNYI